MHNISRVISRFIGCNQDDVPVLPNEPITASVGPAYSRSLILFS